MSRTNHNQRPRVRRIDFGNRPQNSSDDPTVQVYRTAYGVIHGEYYQPPTNGSNFVNSSNWTRGDSKWYNAQINRPDPGPVQYNNVSSSSKQ